MGVVPPCSRVSSSHSWGPGGLLAGVGRTDEEVGALGKEHIALSDEERYISVMHAPDGSHGLGVRHGAMDGDMSAAFSQLGRVSPLAASLEVQR